MTEGAHAAPPTRRSWPQRVAIAVLVVLSTGAALGAVAAGYGAWKLDHVERADVELSAVLEGQPTNYLIVGSDSREGLPADPNAKGFGNPQDASGKRSDTIIVVRVNPQDKQLLMLSLPRDLWVPIAGQSGNERINTAFALGKQEMIDTIEEALEIPINRYLEVDFAGFEGLVNAIDGVPMWFDTPMRDQRSGLFINQAGCTTLDGSQSLAFVRSRSLQYQDDDGDWVTDGTADLGRISRQQHFARRALARSLGKALNPITLKRLVDAGSDNVTLDTGLGIDHLRALAERFRTYDPALLTTYSLPVESFVTDGGADVVRLEEDAAEPILDQFRPPPPPITEAEVTVTVLNGTNVAGQAADLAGALQRTGMHVDRWGNGSEMGLDGLERTAVSYGDGGAEAADLVARHLTAGADVVADPDLGEEEVVVVTGDDFTTVEAVARPPGFASGSFGPPPPSAAEQDPGSPTTDIATLPAPEAPPTTSEEPVGRVPGEPPPGVDCG